MEKLVGHNDINLSPGCSVYVVVYPICLRSSATVHCQAMTNIIFDADELVSIDLIRPPLDMKSEVNGPYLRLSDGRGWLFENNNGKPYVEPVPVRDGLWTMYVNNPPVGLSPRTHPNDRPDFMSDIVLRYAQKIVCDKKVTHPSTSVNFYRIQGTQTWLFDRRPKMDSEKDDAFDDDSEESDSDDNDDSENDDTDYVFTLLQEDQVKHGVYAYRTLPGESIRVRATPFASGNIVEPLVEVGASKIVSVDVVQKSPYDDGNGPFLHLSDGSGWLFEGLGHEKYMEEIPVTSGQWKFCVVNSAGIALCKHPNDNDEKYSLVYKEGEYVSCDYRLEAPYGINFYRVVGTKGWIFDERRGEDYIMLQPVAILGDEDKIMSSGWSVEFVRGVGLAIDAVDEIDFNELSHVISFKNKNKGARINVYYTTKTIGTALDHPTRGKTQLFRRDCTSEQLVEIMKNPRAHTDKGYRKKRKFEDNDDDSGDIQTESSRAQAREEEEAFREEIVACDKTLKMITQKRQQLVASIRKFDKSRLAQAQTLHDEMKRHLKRINHEGSDSTCSICNREFDSILDMEQHKERLPCTRCDACGKMCKSLRGLEQHQNAKGRH